MDKANFLFVFVTVMLQLELNQSKWSQMCFRDKINLFLCVICLLRHQSVSNLLLWCSNVSFFWFSSGHPILLLVISEPKLVWEAGPNLWPQPETDWPYPWRKNCWPVLNFQALNGPRVFESKDLEYFPLCWWDNLTTWPEGQSSLWIKHSSEFGF